MTSINKMTTKRFLDIVALECKNAVSEKYNIATKENLEVIQVWYCKTVQNHKGMFIVKNNNIIYPYFIECTYNGDKDELYLDFYEKQFKNIILDCFDYKIGD